MVTPGSTALPPYVTELVRRLGTGGAACSAVVTGPRGAATLVWQVTGLGHPVTLTVLEDDLGVAVAALGRCCTTRRGRR